MNTTTARLGLIILVAASLNGVLIAAERPRPIDLKPFIEKSQFETIGADWILPRGRQVVEGVPFQVDGIVEVAGASARFSNVGRTNVNDIPIGARFEKLYLLAAASRDVNEGVIVARLKLRYADGSMTDLPIEYGRHLQEWMGPRHKGESPLIEPDSRVAWQVQHHAAARRDDSLRLFYLGLPNPDPLKEVSSLSILSARARGGLMVAALTLGPEAVERLPDTLPRIEEHFHLEGGTGEKPALTGRITDENGSPVTDGLVRVMSVKTVDSTDRLTPEDNEVVGREAKTDATGHYRLTGLSERLLYRLLIASSKSQAILFDGADPLAGPAHHRLTSATGGGASSFLVHGKLLGPDGKPVVGASVKPDGVRTDGSTRWGGNIGFPSEVMTGLSGEFIMGRDERFTSMSVDISAPGLAPAKVWLPASNGVHTVQLGIGAQVTGRVIKDGVALADVEVAVAGANRNSEVFAGHYETRTDQDGRFRLTHLPPNTDWYFYGSMRSLSRDGSLPPRPVRTGEHGDAKELGEVQVEPGVTLAGRIKTKDGQPLPSGLRVNVSFDTAWDSQTARVDQEGYFEVIGLHKGLVTVSANSRGWQPSAENRSLDDWNPWSLTGLLDGDKRDLLFVIEKKERNYNNYSSGNGQLPEQDQARRRPLFGAEESGPPPIVLSGTLVDDKTGEPVRNVRITPGRKPPSTAPPVGGLLQTLVEAVRTRPTPWNERPYWEHSRQETFADGRFTLHCRALSSLPMLRLEADGYDVLETGTFATNATQLVLRMKKGSGPAGMVVYPDGRPAQGVSVAFGAANEQFSIGADGRLSVYGRNRDLITTGADGRFAFPSKSGGARVFAASPEGWASVAVGELPEDGRIHLLPWAQATGTLLDASGKPMPNTRMALELNRNYQARDAWANFQERPETDANGAFRFERVPPGEVRLVRLETWRNNGWRHLFQTNFVAEPGKTNAIGSITAAPSSQVPGF